VPSILVADDDGDICEMIARKLSRAGHDVRTCADGPSVLAALQRATPDLVVLDLNMPGMSGLDLCRALRTDPGTADVPVLMLTARTQDADVEAGFAAGADDYLHKPFSPRELVSRVDTLLQRA
jgi:two-component system response regulator MtrA